MSTSFHTVYRRNNDGTIEDAMFSRSSGEMNPIPFALSFNNPNDNHAVYYAIRDGDTFFHERLPFQFFNEFSNLYPVPTR